MASETIQRLEALLKKQEFHPRQGSQPEEPQQPEPKENEEFKKVSQRLDELGKALQNNNSQQTQTEVLRGLLADPEIAAIIEARQRGEKPKATKEKPVDDEPDLELDQLSGLGDDSIKAFKALEKRQEKLIAQKLKEIVTPLQQDLQVVSKSLQKRQNSEIEKRIEEVREQHPDFMEHLETMREINLATIGRDGQSTLDPEELYMLAKKRAGQVVSKKQKELESERPTHEATGASQRRKYDPGTNGMRQAIDDAFERTRGRLRS